jgi:ABC-type Mn2+/Zn2+ transport system permease subunit
VPIAAGGPGRWAAVIGWWAEAFEAAFMQRALLGGLVAVVATSLVGTWVVLRGLTFLGDALAHGVIPGIALAVLAGFSPVLGALVAALVMSGVVTVVSARTTMREDTSIGLLFVGMLSAGVIIVSRSRSFATDVTALLFGDVLGVTAGDITVQAVAAAAVLAATIVLYRPFFALSFNERKAATLGMRPRLTQAALLALLAISIVASFQAIGTLLVFGLLIGPPATASLVVRRIPLIMALAMASGALAVVLGLALSYHYGTAGGATIAAVAVGQFFVALTVRSALDHRARTAVVGPGPEPSRS